MISASSSPVLPDHVDASGKENQHLAALAAGCVDLMAGLEILKAADREQALDLLSGESLEELEFLDDSYDLVLFLVYH